MSEATITRLRPAKPQDLNDLIREAQAEVQRLCDVQRSNLIFQIEQACAVAAAVADNPAHPPGVRDLARRFVEDEQARIVTLTAIINRS